MLTSNARLARALLLAILGVGSIGCGRFPRNNPVDPDADGTLTLENAESAQLAVSDLNTLAPANNENGAAEPGETVLVTVPLEVTWARTGLSANITVEVADSADDDEQACVLSLMAQGALGNQLLVSLPPTRNQPQPVLVGPIRVTIASDCEPGTTLDFDLNVTVTQTQQDFALSFGLDVAEPEGGPTLVDVLVADPPPGTGAGAGNGDGEINPGETVVLSPELQNGTSSLLPGLFLRVKSAGRECLASTAINGVASGMMAFGTLQPGQSTMSGDLLTASVASGCEAGDDLVVPFEVSDAAGRSWDLPCRRTRQAAGNNDPDAGASMNNDPDAGASMNNDPDAGASMNNDLDAGS